MRTLVRLSLAAACFLPLSLALAAEPQSTATFDDAVGPALRPALEVADPTFRHPRPAHGDLRSFVLHWNEVAINASGLDHTPVAPDVGVASEAAFGPVGTSGTKSFVLPHIQLNWLTNPL